MCRKQHLPRLFSLLSTVAGLVGVLYAQAVRADVITDWNTITCDAIRSDTGSAHPTMPGPTWAARNLAMVHAAMYDAVNCIDQTHAGYLTSTPAAPGASMEAAAAQAAYQVLVNLYPSQQNTLDTALANSLAAIPNSAGKTAGITLGAACGVNMWNARLNDGANNMMTFTHPTGPGYWSADPLHPNQMALAPNWGSVTPFALQNVSNFDIAPPPSLDSQAYTDAFNQVKSLGAKNSSTRTPDQTEIGSFWAYDVGGLGPPPILYNEVTQTIAVQEHNTLVQNARLFALTNLAMADAAVAAWRDKYMYDFWRPVTAIRNADQDGNPDTLYDPNWEPLGAPNGNDPFTPPFPSYASGHATFGGALFETLTDFYDTDQLNFTLTSDELPGITRSYTSFSQANEENAWSRIYLGIHWSFDAQAGIQQGGRIGDYVFANELQAVPEPGTLVMLGSLLLYGVSICRRHKRIRE